MEVAWAMFKSLCTSTVMVASSIGVGLWYTGHLKVIEFTEHMWVITLH